MCINLPLIRRRNHRQTDRQQTDSQGSTISGRRNGRRWNYPKVHNKGCYAFLILITIPLIPIRPIKLVIIICSRANDNGCRQTTTFITLMGIVYLVATRGKDPPLVCSSYQSPLIEFLFVDGTVAYPSLTIWVVTWKEMEGALAAVTNHADGKYRVISHQ